MLLFGVHARIAAEVSSILEDLGSLRRDAGVQAKLRDLLGQLARDFTGRDLYEEEFVFVCGHGEGGFEELLRAFARSRLEQLEQGLISVDTERPTFE